MKKILFVLNEMGAGGIAKSLSNLLYHLEDYKNDYQVDLFLLRKDGCYINDVPEYVNIIEAKKTLKYFGSSQRDCKKYGKIQYLNRFIIAGWSKVFTNYLPLKIGVKQNKLEKEYDAAISFAHTQNNRSMTAGSVEFVLGGVKAKKKFCVIHGDVVLENLLTKSNIKKFARFDKLFSVSQSCSQQVVDVCPKLKNVSDFLYNTQRNDIILKKSNEKEINFDKTYLNLIMCSRLEEQKAPMRFLGVVKKLFDSGYKFNLHILGDGTLKKEMEEFVNKNNLNKNVIFYGMQLNPFPYVKAADLFILPSYYEAAPMVYNESMLLKTPVFTTNIISAEEMVGDKGFICGNDEQSIFDELKKVLDNPEQIKEKKDKLKNYTYDNKQIVEKLLSLI